MYPPATFINKESPKGGVALGKYYIPQGTTMFVSWRSYVHVHISISDDCVYWQFVTSVMCRNPEFLYVFYFYIL